MRDSGDLQGGRPLLRILFLLLTFIVTSCSVPKGAVHSPVAVPDTFSKTGSIPMTEKWWLAFNDDNLNNLMKEALSDNLNIRGTWDRLEQARAIARKSGAAVFPSLDGSAGASRTVNKISGSEKTYSNKFSLGLAASYELDLWGRVRAAKNAAELDVLASQEDLYASVISLTAEVASAWYRLVEQRGQIKLLNGQIKTNEKYLDLVTFKFRGAQVPVTDVLQQRQSLESTRAEKIIAESNRIILEHQLASLLGKTTESIVITEQSELPLLLPLPDTGLPAELIKRRPDIRMAYFRAQAADQRLTAAISERLPRVSLSAGIETNAGEVNDLFKNWLSNLTGNLIAPLIDGGRRASEVDRTKAVYSESIHVYGQVVLKSLREVEDALVQESQQHKLLENLNKQSVLSKTSSDQTREKYIHGAMDFLRFLTSILGHQSLERNKLKAQRELIDYRINLYRALAGGWGMKPPPKTFHYILKSQEKEQ